jgi:hypothetical protein
MEKVHSRTDSDEVRGDVEGIGEDKNHEEKADHPLSPTRKSPNC